MEIKDLSINEIKQYENNPRKNDEAVDYVANSIKEFGFKVPIIIDKNNVIIAGHTRLKAAKKLGMKKVPCIMADDLTPDQVKAFRLADNKVAEKSFWDIDKLEQELDDIFDIDMADFGFSVDKIGDEIDQGNFGEKEEVKKTLKERFLAVPTTVLNARSGEWQERKHQWLNLGIKSYKSRMRAKASGSLSGTVPGYYLLKRETERKIGRKLTNEEFSNKYLEDLINKKESATKATKTGGILSVFDPVLCELMYYWFSFPGAKVLDPFSGGSVRGIVSSFLDQKYTGVDLRQDQIEANIENAKEILDGNYPTWICGDSKDIDQLAPGQYDFVFSCPPYFDLEKYSEDDRDLSNQTYEEFLRLYNIIIKKCVDMLKENRFAVFVVGEVRDRKTGFYRNLVAETIKAFNKAGAIFYNESILITPFGTVQIRAGNSFSKSRKLEKAHQNVLVFYKGNPKMIKDIYKDIKIKNISEDEE